MILIVVITVMAMLLMIEYAFIVASLISKIAKAMKNNGIKDVEAKINRKEGVLIKIEREMGYINEEKKD